jgi:hypothetical protein
MIEANRAVARMGYTISGFSEPVIEATTGWYGLIYYLATPRAVYT